MLISECWGRMGAGRLSQKHWQATLTWLRDSELAGTEPASRTRFHWDIQAKTTVLEATPNVLGVGVCVAQLPSHGDSGPRAPTTSHGCSSNPGPSFCALHHLCSDTIPPRWCREGSPVKRSTLDRTANPFCFSAPAVEPWSYPSPSLPGFQLCQSQKGQPPIELLRASLLLP